MDGRGLTFVNFNQPARRYLYYRYIIIYHTWAPRAKGEIVWGGHQRSMKADVYGNYLRLSMLQTPARFVNDQFSPEDLIEGNTFTEASSCPARRKHGEEALVMSLALKIEEEEQG